MVTITAVQPKGRYGVLSLDPQGGVQSFYEKSAGSAWISGGFFAMQPEIFGYLNDGENMALEGDPIDSVAKDGELQAYKHTEFWQTMDTLKDKMYLTDLWMTGKAPWAVWL